MSAESKNIRVSGLASRLAFEGGVCAVKDGLGVFVGNENEIENTPAGWVFINYATATPEIVQESINHLMLGRSTWPEKDN